MNQAIDLESFVGSGPQSFVSVGEVKSIIEPYHRRGWFVGEVEDERNELMG